MKFKSFTVPLSSILLLVISCVQPVYAGKVVAESIEVQLFYSHSGTLSEDFQQWTGDEDYLGIAYGKDGTFEQPSNQYLVKIKFTGPGGNFFYFDEEEFKLTVTSKETGELLHQEAFTSFDFDMKGVQYEAVMLRGTCFDVNIKIGDINKDINFRCARLR